MASLEISREYQEFLNRLKYYSSLIEGSEVGYFYGDVILIPKLHVRIRIDNSMKRGEKGIEFSVVIDNPQTLYFKVVHREVFLVDCYSLRENNKEFILQGVKVNLLELYYHRPWRYDISYDEAYRELIRDPNAYEEIISNRE